MADPNDPIQPGSTDDAFERLKQRRADESASRQMYQLSGVGFEFLVAVGGLAVLGWWLDKKLGWSPALTIVGVTIGFALGLYRLIKVGKRTQQ